MANNKEGQSLREYENRKKRIKMRRRVIIGTTLLVLVVLGATYLIRLYNRSFENYNVIRKTDITGSNAVGYIPYDGAVVKYSMDGATALDTDGSLLWNSSYEMSDPIADVSGKYVVIADRDGKSIHIFNKKGQIGNITTIYDIIKVEVASQQGVVAALMQEENGHRIILYDVDGTELSVISTTANKDGYPLDISLSEDGEKLVTSYLSYSGGNLTNTISFYNFGEVGKNHTDRFVGGWSIDDGSIMPRVTFVTNDVVCAYKDNGFILYSMEELPSQASDVVVEDKIKSVLYNDKYVGMVLQKEGTSSKQLVIYDLKGNKVLNKELDYDYESIYFSGEEIIMYGKMSCLIMKTNGKVKFRGTFDSNIMALYSANAIDKYYLANEADLVEIQLKE